MGCAASSSTSEQVKQKVDEMIALNKVVVFSKSYCPYCRMAKEVLSSVGAQYFVLELDRESDGDAIQSYLAKLTGAKTVPRVFIGGQCIGGGSETQGLHSRGQLVPKLQSIGAL